MSRVLVTGGEGFLGTRVVDRLRAAGHSVVTADSKASATHVGDLADPEFTGSLPDVDVVIHAAAVQYVTPTIPLLRRRPWFERNNVVATRNLVDRYDGKIEFFVQVGTSMMYRQDGSQRYTKDSTLGGTGVYSESKSRSVQIAQGMSNPVGVMIPCIIGGPGREGLFRGFVGTINRWGFAVRPGSGSFPTHAVYVDDAAGLIATMVEKRATGFYNAGGLEPLTINDWIAIIQDELAVPTVRVIRVPYWLIRFGARLTGHRIIASEQKQMLGMPHVLDLSESLALGWTPTFTNEEIVRSIARYITGR